MSPDIEATFRAQNCKAAGLIISAAFPEIYITKMKK